MKKEFGFEDFTGKTFREELLRVFKEKQKKNRSYSLRAFSRDLKISQSSLSEFLRGKRQFSAKKIDQLQKIILADDIFLSATTSPFRVISEKELLSSQNWIADCILELTKIKGFKDDFKWISDQLNVEKKEAKIVFEELVRAGMLIKRKNGKWSAVDDFTTTLGKIEHKELIYKKYIETIHLQENHILNYPIEEASHVGITFAINPDDLPEARKKIYVFMRELSQYLERPKVEKKNIYKLNIGLFPLKR